ncbi:hypothetical protein [Ktedonobacter sp. SOSP1-52]|uniref:hypothetical protein n=1 Tax=Ktedonobacter sp. SOSP1-52 TaxID=2778366 RepID=UPI00191690E1|nr:hypothetical protein [Ktedonobacter sp. SOSP1-52]
MMSPFGVLAGEVNGLPFTAFDSEPGGAKMRRTYWAIHLPVAYPRVQVRARLPDGLFSALKENRLRGGRPALRVREASFRPTICTRRPLTPQVRSATMEFELVGWRIEGRDLILERGTPSRSPPTRLSRSPSTWPDLPGSCLPTSPTALAPRPAPTFHCAVPSLPRKSVNKSTEGRV